VIVANRLPVRSVPSADGTTTWEPSPGGLASALGPALRERAKGDAKAVWIGWPGVSGPAEVPDLDQTFSMRTVELSDAEQDEFYFGFANATLWPLYHDAIRAPTFDRGWWRTYRSVNARYADAAAEAAGPDAAVWIHDYQLQLVPRMLRERRPDLRIGFFLHIPFPPQELFLQLPWRREIIRGMLGADLVGFQVPGAAANFSRLARRLVGAGGTDARIETEGRTVLVGAFPISVDTGELARRAAEPGVAARARQIRRDLGDPDCILLGVDRLDYTKGIDRRVRAVAELFADGTLTPSRHVMVQIAVPSREGDPLYQAERHRLEQLVSEVNGDFSGVGHPVVHYLHQSVPFDELVALYRAADIMLVTPLRDGMNLVAKEYVACRVDGEGVLILSEFAGAATQLRGAITVNPHDLDGVKEAIALALSFGPSEARSRMRRLRRIVQRNDVHAWARSFLTALDQAAPGDAAGVALP
jgi:trehalose 6-phosphate synthase